MSTSTIAVSPVSTAAQNASARHLSDYFAAFSLYALLLPVLSAFVVAFGMITTLPLAFLALPGSWLASVWCVYRLNGRQWNQTLRPLYAVVPLFVLGLYGYSFLYDTSVDPLSYHLQRMYLMADGWNPVWQALPTQWSQPGADLFWPGALSGIDHLRITCFAQAMSYANLAVYFWFPIAECSMVWHLLLFIAPLYPVWKFLQPLRTLNRFLPGLLTLVILCNPITLIQLTLHWVDGSLAALFTTALFALLVYTRDNDRIMLFFAFPALAFLAVIKSTGLLFAAGISLGFCFFLLIYRRPLLRSMLLRAILPAFLLGFCLGGDTYLRNLTTHGNPVFPYGSSLSASDEKETNEWREVSLFDYHILPTENRFVKFFLTQIYASPSGLDDKGLPKDRFTPTYSQQNYLGLLYGPAFLLALLLSVVALLTVFRHSFARTAAVTALELRLHFFAFLLLLPLSFFHPDTHIPRFFPHYWLLPIFLVLIALCFYRTRWMLRGLWVFLLLLFLNSAIIFGAALCFTADISSSIRGALQHLKAHAEFYELSPSATRKALVHADFMLYPIMRLITDRTDLPMKISNRNNLPYVRCPYLPAAIRFMPKSGQMEADANFAIHISQMWTSILPRYSNLFFTGDNLTHDTYVFLDNRRLDSYLTDNANQIVAVVPHRGFLPGPGTYNGVLRNRFFAMPFTAKAEEKTPGVLTISIDR